MLTNGQTTEQVKDFKHIGWGISVRENNNDWAENFAKCNHLNGTKKQHSDKTMNAENQQQLHEALYSMTTGRVMWKECWNCSQRDKNRPDPAHMHRLRKTRGFSRKDCVEEETSVDSKYSGRHTELADGLASASGPDGGLQVSEEIAGLWTYLPRPSQQKLGRSRER